MRAKIKYKKFPKLKKSTYLTTKHAFVTPILITKVEMIKDNEFGDKKDENLLQDKEEEKDFQRHDWDFKKGFAFNNWKKR